MAARRAISRRQVVGVFAALAGLAAMAGGGAASARVRPNRVQVPAGAELTRGQVRAWANAAGVSEAHMVLAIMVASERPGRAHAQEAQVVAATAVNRTGFPRAFGRDAWEAVVNDAPTTGKQQGGWRPYATSRPEVAHADLQYYVSIADAALRRGPGQLGNVTNFHHLRGDRAREVTARWRAAGYQVVDLGVPATVFAPTPAKAAALRGAA